MSDIKPTIGLWQVREQGDANHYVILKEDGRWLAVVQHNGEQVVEQQRANLAAMAAGPQLLTAAELSLHLLRDFFGVEHGQQRVAEAWAALEAGIGAAGGRTDHLRPADQPRDPIGDINQFAAAEGWGIFNDKDIQRDDEADVFASDDDAIEHVRRMAMAGSSLHLAALELADLEDEPALLAAEVIEWWNPDTRMPEADETVMVSLADPEAPGKPGVEPTWPGFFDGARWIDCTSGAPFVDDVTAWAPRPKGVR